MDPARLVLIPSFNSGAALVRTVRAARAAWTPVWVVIDGSTDGSDAALREAVSGDPAVRILSLPRNTGKGAAILYGLREAEAAGFTHALTMDADGQHPAEEIPRFMAASASDPQALVLGVPMFGDDAPRLRVRGRRISNWWANFETAGAGIGDSLFGFRVYPVTPLRQVMERTRWMRRFDFDPEAAVRLVWAGLRPTNLPAPVRYPRQEEGGVSHFRYGRDNLLLTFMHVRLVLGMIPRLPRLIRLRSAASHVPPHPAM